MIGAPPPAMSIFSLLHVRLRLLQILPLAIVYVPGTKKAKPETDGRTDVGNENGGKTLLSLNLPLTTRDTRERTIKRYAKKTRGK